MDKIALFFCLLFLGFDLVLLYSKYLTGADAYERGDYKTALNELLLLAKEGVADAQTKLGIMYFKGWGVEQDYREVVKWFQLAAEQGEKDAQHHLGRMFFEGKALPLNYVLAHMWVNLAAAQGHEGVPWLRKTIENEMTPDQLAGAQRLAGEWKPK